MRPAFCSSFLIFSLLMHASKCSDAKNKPLAKITKNDIVKRIVAKVTNMTLNAFAKIEPQKKAQMLENIRKRLVNASEVMGPNGKKYVDLVMEGVKATAYEDSDFSYIGTVNSRKAALRHIEIDNNAKNKLVLSIAKKIEALKKSAFYNAKTNEEKQDILNKIIKRVVNAANKHKIMVLNKHQGIKPFGKLTVKDVELVLQQKFSNGTKKTNIDLETKSTNFTEDDFELKGNEIDRSIMEIIKPESLLDDNAEETTVNSLMFTSKLDLCGCSCVVNETCAKISALSKFICRRHNVVIQLEKICDGVSDCPDKSDEENCSENALNSLHLAGSVMYDIEKVIPRGCLTTNLDEMGLTSQHIVLKNVLQRQTAFLKKYEHVKQHLRVSSDSEKRTVVNQVNLVVSTVGFALQAAFCAHEDLSIYSRRNGDLLDEDLDDLLQYRSWAPPLCVCDEEACAYSNCSTSCERNCWYRHSLGQWACPAVNFDSVVQLDLLCDGKVDCYDETDESGCSTGTSADKFEAGDIYNFILKLLARQVTLKEYHPVLNKLNSLQQSIKSLQKYSIKKKPDIAIIKDLRDKCFSELVSIYDDLVEQMDLLEKVDEAYMFLAAVNQKLVSALKRSSTGNERIMSNDNCLCRGGVCALQQCSQACVLACTVQSKITKHSCKGDTNRTITLDSICDGLDDCPQGDDEEDCRKEICRNHHLVVLRTKLQLMKDFHKGIAVGDTLRSWKAKAIADLLVAEKKGRVTRRGVRKAVHHILQDLTMSYASLGNFRRSKDRVEQSVDRFLELARVVKDTLKTCTK